jgi:hypothetical protein
MPATDLGVATLHACPHAIIPEHFHDVTEISAGYAGAHRILTEYHRLGPLRVKVTVTAHPPRALLILSGRDQLETAFASGVAGPVERRTLAGPAAN